MRRALCILLLLISLFGETSPSHGEVSPTKVHRSEPRIVRHYLNGPHGWTRTTQYVDCCVTASGVGVYYGEVAADPSIPFGATMVIPRLGRFTVYDRGGAVYGAHIDIWVPYYPYGIRDYYRGVYWYR